MTIVSNVGSEILVNTATRSDQFDPQIATLANGGFVVTWTDFSRGSRGATGDTDGYAVKGEVFAANGVKVGSEILVNTVVKCDQFNSWIVSLPNGGFVVNWEDYSHGAGGHASTYAIEAQVFDAGGAKIGSEILVAGGQAYSQITALPSGGFVVTWVGGSQGVGGATGDNSGSAVKAQVFAADGAKIGSEILVNTAIHGYQSLPQITHLSNGGAVFCL